MKATVSLKVCISYFLVKAVLLKKVFLKTSKIYREPPPSKYLLGPASARLIVEIVVVGNNGLVGWYFDLLHEVRVL